jgi:tRNA pseudouridine32 synthase/23S rRNA pseudouridine746 synthase
MFLLGFIMSTVCAAQASSIVMPEHIRHCPNVVDFLTWHFSQIPFDVWRSRILAGKVHWQNGELVNLDTRYRARTRVFYYREVVTETKVPFTETANELDGQKTGGEGRTQFYHAGCRRRGQ